MPKKKLKTPPSSDSLTEIEEFYITNNRTMSIDELSKKLGLTKTVIQKFLDSLPAVKEVEPQKETILKQLQTKAKGVVVMTQSVSEQLDAINYKKAQPKTGCVHKIIVE
jgi:predicted transcriptional regulator